MAKSVFDYPDYKPYLSERILERGRGERSRIAEALRCHLAYVSQVLNGSADFSLEQADLLNTYFNHSEDEAEFFLLLVSRARAGLPSLEKRFDSRIKRTLQDRLMLENRLRNQKYLTPEDQAIYYSAWYYSAIHLLITIPQFQTREQLIEHLRLSPHQVARALDFLVASGLAQSEAGRYRAGEVRLHLKNDSAWIARHHSSWRMQAIRATEREDPKSFHYTSVVSMDEKDAPQVRKILVDAIEQVRAVVRSAPKENAAYCYTLDFFGI
jgi:uncharacterized protein (TIGR02147 family)